MGKTLHGERVAAPAAPSRIELTPGYFQITATPHLAVYDPTVQFEFWFSEKRIADIRQVETTARYLGTALYWIAASMAYSRVSTFSGDYIRVTDNKGKTHDVLTGSDDGRHSNTSLAWGAGVQFNPTESVAVDVAYEGSGSGDWRTNSFIVGVGYKF
ncbi:Ail/Lom family outer membrane beta-barrel protein [Escherichia coli]